MTRKLNRDSSVEALTTLPLKRATIQIGSRRKVAIATVSLEFIGRRSRSVRLTVLPKSTKPFRRSENIKFEISRVQAWALAEWIAEESTKRAPLS